MILYKSTCARECCGIETLYQNYDIQITVILSFFKKNLFLQNVFLSISEINEDAGQVCPGRHLGSLSAGGAMLYLWFVSPLTELIDHISPAWPGLTVMLSAHCLLATWF